MSRPRPAAFSPAASVILANAAVFTVLAAVLAGCHRDGCVGGDDGACLPPAACAQVHYACTSTAPALRVAQIGTENERVSGPKALAAPGDYVLENDLIRVVLDGPENPHGLAPTGGSILDFAPLGPGLGDQTNGISHAAGLLPRDAVHYESAAILDPGMDPAVPGAFVAVVFRGHLEGDARVTVVTRYELRPCEPGIRVRSDLYNGAPNPNTLYLTDGFFWGDNGLVPFVPGPGLGFMVPNLDLLHIDDAWRSWPFMAARSQSAPDVAYASVPCDRGQGAGFNSTTLSASGVPLVSTQPGDGFHFERFLTATAGPGLSSAVNEALRLRSMVHGEPAPVVVQGRLVASGLPVAGQSGRGGSLLFYEPAAGGDPDDQSRRIPWTEAVPGSDGTFSVSLPPNRSYRVQPFAFGVAAAAATSFAVAGSDSGPYELGDITITASAHLAVSVESQPGVAATYAELVVVPVAAPVGPVASGPSLYSLFPGCIPMLGPPDGGAPACNRSLTTNGSFDLSLPPGEYYVYATRGPFASLDRAQVTVGAGDSVSVSLVVESLASQLLPEGVVSGDFHVHGGASYDSAIPDFDRVVSFLATGVDVLVASDHNVITNYTPTLAALGATHQIAIIPGVEQTPNILWYYVPGSEFPKVLGHFNFWPLPPQMLATRNGDPWAELREPGQMMDDMDAVFANPAAGVRQLNHPYGASKLGRDQGYLRAIGYDPTTPIVPGKSFAADALLRAPGGNHRNIDWDVQEVMTGASRADWLRYRALWFSLLSQGFKRAGAANSDSHTLFVERIGYPRNLIWGNHDKTALDVDAFDADVRAGHMVGTNGPVLDATIADGAGHTYRPGLDAITVTSAATLNVALTAAPWIPVEEVRVFVNGRLALVDSDVAAAFANVDHFGTQPARYTGKPIALAGLLPSSGDAWIVVEAGMHQDTPPDTDGDGLPDLLPTDVPVRPASASDPLFDIEAIAPGVWPTAFSNPFLLDLDGGGWAGPGLASP